MSLQLSHSLAIDVMMNKMWSHQPLPDLVPQDLKLQQTEPGAAILLSIRVSVKVVQNKVPKECKCALFHICCAESPLTGS